MTYSMGHKSPREEPVCWSTLQRSQFTCKYLHNLLIVEYIKLSNPPEYTLRNFPEYHTFLIRHCYLYECIENGHFSQNIILTHECIENGHSFQNRSTLKMGISFKMEYSTYEYIENGHFFQNRSTLKMGISVKIEVY